MAKNLQKPKIFILGTKTHLYELIFHSHIEEDQTKPVYFMREKNQFDQEKFNYLRFLIFQKS